MVIDVKCSGSTHLLSPASLISEPSLSLLSIFKPNACKKNYIVFLLLSNVL